MADRATARLTTPEEAEPLGVWKVRGKILGRNGYYARTSRGSVVGNCVYLAGDDESDARIVARLHRVLRSLERPALQLVRPTPRVSAAIDGPSPKHPEIEQLEQDPRVIPFVLPDPSRQEPPDLEAPFPIAPEAIYDRLYYRLYGRMP